MKKVTALSLIAMKKNGVKIAALTAYDASFAKLFDENGIDMLLVGDSLGMVLQGEASTLPVTVDHIAYHTRCVAKGVERALLVADLPFMAYATTQQCYENAAKLMVAGASMVKVEGAEWLLDSISGLVERGIPVCGHLGLTPQSVNILGGFKIQGREKVQADRLIASALALEKAGIQLLVLECIPIELTQKIASQLSIPVIGIGAGVNADGQILVMHDMLGISANYMPKFTKNYLIETGNLHTAVQRYVDDVKSSVFPGPEHSFE